MHRRIPLRSEGVPAHHMVVISRRSARVPAGLRDNEATDRNDELAEPKAAVVAEEEPSFVSSSLEAIRL